MTKKTYAVIDIETTGGRASRDRITEIAIVLHDGKEIVDQFETLLNPERTIPHNITQLTGISQDMVEEAPKFYEVAKKIVEMTQGCIFVAHNVRFDYSFIQEEFRRLGYTYTRRQLCTVRLSRKTFPGLRSYSLGNLIKHFGINVKDRHRAMADTMATVELLEKIFKLENSEETADDLINLGIKESKLPKNISLDQLHGLPEGCGVYYFHDLNGEIIYIGKSINIKKRVMQHFVNKNHKGDKLQESVSDISYEITGSELVALLKESHEIKYHHPRINRAQRLRKFQYVLHSYHNQKDYLCIDLVKANAAKRKKLTVLQEYPSLISAKAGLHRIMEKYNLCERYCNVDNSIGKPCFYYHLKKCKGACTEEESPEEYNQRVKEAVGLLERDFHENFVIIDHGPSPEEQSVILIEDGRYCGFGTIDKNESYEHIDQFREQIKPFQHNSETSRIIRSFLHKEKGGPLKVLRF